MLTSIIRRISLNEYFIFLTFLSSAVITVYYF